MLLINRKTLNKHILLCKELGWVIYNSKTTYYQIKAFDKIREENNWEVRLSFPINLNTIQDLKAITGAVIYGYLHKDFWRKVKREKSVQIKGCTYYFLSPRFNYKEQYAPVSIYGVEAIFNITPATASRLKNSAAKKGFIKLKKNYSDIIDDKYALQKGKKYNDLKQNIVYKKGKNREQLVDTTYPLFHFKKRKLLQP
ncbi:hypothetical protein BTO04_13175 [Polaribacter sp. SA4-10]|uniref:hypothetical protein n=1 Tax=Polaribacter sp. SA4-10 TaxID=754397 RepID=UPI000B3CECFA|nr:hypothetical protein [Polaribacter sp. SA4-10]ARV07583.1 hypothetical protein BTO04_13175 [Polaribacter sp. SA4-10]